MQKIGIIVPAYNEEKRIGNTLKEYLEYFDRLKRDRKIKNYLMIVVVNNSQDRTREIAEKYTCKHLKVLEFVKGGKGFAVIEGFKFALKKDLEIIGFVDADMSTRPEYFYELVRNIGGFGCVIASRYIGGAKVNPKNTFLRIFASKVYNAFIRSILLIPYRDTQCGAKAFRKKAIQKVINKIGMTQWAFDIELLYKLRKNGYLIKEIPTVWSNKDYSTINFWESGPWMALSVIRLRLLFSPFKKIVSVYDRLLNYIRNNQLKKKAKKK